jgi:hypothetical protein
VIIVPLLFPTGSPPSPRWKPVLWLDVATIATMATLAALNPVLELQDLEYAVENPIGVEAVGSAEKSTSGSILLVVFLVAGFLTILSVIVRFRRAHGIERQQLKWFTLAVASLLLLIPIDFVTNELVANLAFGLVVGLVPLAAGAAILRYRLYEVDVVINRTLVYGALTALLAGAYLGLVLLFQLVLNPVTEGSGVAVALSTLAVAALFRPARAHVQGLVDRRFYRRRYDAQQTLAGFAARLRDEVDLDALRGELTGIVATTMQPAHVSLWLRQAEGRRG